MTDKMTWEETIRQTVYRIHKFIAKGDGISDADFWRIRDECIDEFRPALEAGMRCSDHLKSSKRFPCVHCAIWGGDDTDCPTIGCSKVKNEKARPDR